MTVSVHRDGGGVPDGLATQAVQQAQVGTENLPVQSGAHPEPHHPLYRGDADAEAATLSHRSSVPAAGEPAISMTALLELLKDADPEMKAKLRLALRT